MNTDPDDSNSEEGFVMKWLTNRWTLSAICVVFLIVAFYAEENWRGAVIWRQAQSEIAAAGESLDPAKFIPAPAPVPDEQNFGALPIFQLEGDPSLDSPNYLAPLRLRESLVRLSKIPWAQNSVEKDGLPYLGNWSKGESIDLPAVQKQLAEVCRLNLPGIQIPSGATPAEMIDLLCPALSELRAANPTHPYCRFNEDYQSMPPAARSLGGVTAQIALAKDLSYQERLALMGKQPGLALDDFKVTWKVEKGLRQEPTLIAGLVSIGVVAIQLAVVTEGLAEHVWNDRQLAELDRDLGEIDFLKGSQFYIRGEVANFEVPDVDFFKNHRLRMRELLVFGGVSPSMVSEDYLQNFTSSCMAISLPVGWFDQYKAEVARFHLLGTLKMVDPEARRFYPEKEAHALRLIQYMKGTGYWRDFLTKEFSSVLNSVKKFAYAQVHVDQARIVCRLERYRLAHGTYPEALKDLVPAYGAELPFDVMNGEPFHYSLMKDGTYLLYSVGWDQKDDGGAGAIPTQSVTDGPDWVWGNHPVKPTP